MDVIVNSQEAAELVKQGVKTKDELLRGLIRGPQANALPEPAREKPLPRVRASILDDDELLL